MRSAMRSRIRHRASPLGGRCCKSECGSRRESRRREPRCGETICTGLLCAGLLCAGLSCSSLFCGSARAQPPTPPDSSEPDSSEADSSEAGSSEAGSSEAGTPEPDETSPDETSPGEEENETGGPVDPQPDPSQGAAPEPPSQPAPVGLVPPRIVNSPPPSYPNARLGENLHPSVVLIVTLDDAGHVVHTLVEHSADPDFDEAAADAVERWTFAPATRDGQPIAARIRVAVHFELPGFDLATSVDPALGGPIDVSPHHEHSHEHGPPVRETAPLTAPASTSDPVRPPAPPERPDEPEEPSEIGVSAEVDAAPAHRHDRGASSVEIERAFLDAAPAQEGADLMNRVPGVFAARAEGMAVGHRINLRGFDAEHGQDIELSVGGIPINLPSHIHGQGYADLGFLIPEVVQRVRATEGVYDPQQGDFAVAGSIAFDLGASGARRGWRVESGYGMFNTFRQLVMWAPEGERDETLAAVQLRSTDGFGQNRGGQTVSAIAQVGARAGSWRLRGLGIVYGALADIAGVVRVDDVESGRVGYYDSYPDPSAQSQNALSARFMAGFFGEHRGRDGSNGGVGIWVGGDSFRLQENFTGYIQRSRTLERVAGRGDLIEQQNQTLSVGLRGRYQTSPWSPWDWANARLELGLDGRVDGLGQTQNLIANRNQTWDERVDASVVGSEIALYGDIELQLADMIRVNGGLRAAALFYEIDDRLGNFVPLVRPRDAFIMGFRRSAGGITAGPRLSAEVRPLEWLSLRAAYGEGYRSPQARTLEVGETAPFTKVRSADLGAVFEVDEILRVSVAGYWTELSDDVAFEPREGRLERIGATRRMGAVVYAQARPTDWFTGALSVTYVNAELLEPPPPTADNPQPAFEAGQNLPYVPPVVLRADVGVHGTLAGDVLGQRLRGRLGVGYSLLSPRPLPFGGFADPVNLLDASASLGWGPVDLGVSVFNLLDTRYAANEFLFTSNWQPDGIPSRVPARHLAAGSPFSLMVTLGVSL